MKPPWAGRCLLRMVLIVQIQIGEPFSMAAHLETWIRIVIEAGQPVLIFAILPSESAKTVVVSNIQLGAIMKIIYRTLFLVPAFIFALVVAGCENTGEGIGEDMQEAGETLEDAAEDAQN